MKHRGVEICSAHNCSVRCYALTQHNALLPAIKAYTHCQMMHLYPIDTHVAFQAARCGLWQYWMAGYMDRSTPSACKGHHLTNVAALHQDDPRFRVVDPICTFVFALLVLFTTRLILSDICDVLMERVPRSLDVATITAQLCRVRGMRQGFRLNPAPTQCTARVPTYFVWNASAPNLQLR